VNGELAAVGAMSSLRPRGLRAGRVGLTYSVVLGGARLRPASPGVLGIWTKLVRRVCVIALQPAVAGFGWWTTGSSVKFGEVVGGAPVPLDHEKGGVVTGAPAPLVLQRVGEAAQICSRPL
jgi:hypothetical protein